MLENKASLIFYNGTIITMEAEEPTICQAVALHKDRIIAVGDYNEIKSYEDSSTKKIDLKGKTMLPGFIDPHGHFTLNAIQRSNLIDCSCAPVGEIKDMEGLIKRLQQAEKKLKKGQVLIGFGFDDTLVSEYAMPGVKELDRVSKERPVILVHASNHIASANTSAFKKAKMWEGYETPVGGTVYRDENGYPSGVVEETAMYPLIIKLAVKNLLKKPVQAVDKGSKEFVSVGVTTANEGASLLPIELLLKLARKRKKLKNRVVICPLVNGKVDKAIKSQQGKAITSDNLLIKGAGKMITDGSIQAHTAYLSKPYHTIHPTRPKPKDYRGFASVDEEKTKKEIMELHKAGRQIAIHCNGDGALDMVLDSFKSCETNSDHDLRHLIIHCQTVREDQLDDMKKLGILPAFFPAHINVWGDGHYNKFLGPDRGERINPIRSALDRGMVYSSHNDAPVTRVNPLGLVWSSVTRLTNSQRVLGEAQKVSAYEALLGVTRYGAYQYHIEDRVGSIQPGLLGDLVILDKNPLECKPEEIKDIQVLSTWVNGKCVYNSEK